MSTALVSLVNGIPTTTSQKVAEVFGKRHDNVIRGIEDLQSKCPKEFCALNFEESAYTNQQGKKQPMYLLTRDGLTLLVMGYTGKEAMKFKLAYIEAFNCMERQLAAQQNAPALPPLSTVESRRTLNTLVRQWANLSGLSFPDCWAEVHVAFDVETVADLPNNKVKEAERWVQARIDKYATNAPARANAPDFPAELVEYDGKNFWKDLEDLIKRIGAINTALAMNVRTGCLMRHEFYADTINNQVGIAQGALVLARGALGDALRLKTAVNVWK